MTARRTLAAVAFAAPLAVVVAHLLLDRLVAALHDLDAAHAWETAHTPRLPGDEFLHDYAALGHQSIVRNLDELARRLGLT